MLVLSLLLALATLILLLPSLSDLVALLRRARRRPSSVTSAGASAPMLVLLIPAHNEALLIANTIQSLRAMRYPAERARLVVVADNCDDDTAAIARREGAECLERVDPVLRGKPRAIAWALEQLDLASFDALVIIDADAVVDPGFALAVAATGQLRDRAAQTYNDVRNRTENSLTRMAGVFSAVRCVLMNGLKARVGLNVPLANGLCIGTDVLRRHGWPAFSICEDWEMYAYLTVAGVRIENVPDARVYAQEARSLRQSSSQRQRWAAGKLMVLRAYLGRILRHPSLPWHAKLDLLAELTAFGPAVHLGVAAVLAALALLLPIPAGRWIAAALGLTIARFVAYTLVAARRDPQPLRALGAFAYLPVYTIWRVLVQIAALRMLGDKPWVRTGRHTEAQVGRVR